MIDNTATATATDAYARIYEEQQPRLVAYARSLTKSSWAAEDLVAEAHFRVWRRLSAGHEIDNVPAYLMTTVRHLASTVGSNSARETPQDPQDGPERLERSERVVSQGRHVDDPAEQVSSVDLLVRVLGQLPDRWVKALWLAEAEGQPLAAIGPQIGTGIKEGATAVLLHRAREGMRQAFLREQPGVPDNTACEPYWVRMPAYVRGTATRRQSDQILAHADICDDCRHRLALLMRTNDRLPALVGPALLVLVVGGTGKYLLSFAAGSAGASTAVSAAAGHGGGVLHAVRHGVTGGAKMPKALALSAGAAAAAVAVTIALTSPQVQLQERSRVPLAGNSLAPVPVAEVPARVPVPVPLKVSPVPVPERVPAEVRVASSVVTVTRGSGTRVDAGTETPPAPVPGAPVEPAPSLPEPSVEEPVPPASDKPVSEKPGKPVKPVSEKPGKPEAPVPPVTSVEVPPVTPEPPVPPVESEPPVPPVESGPPVPPVVVQPVPPVESGPPVPPVVVPPAPPEVPAPEPVPAPTPEPEPEPVAPTPVDPVPDYPAPVDPAPVDPAPVDPAPVDPAPVDPAPVDETPVDETPVDETPVDETPVPDPGVPDPGHC
ncbi:sigma-70 family RNA polymerase sigma factor [Streptomyces sp. NBC_00576]|uniref:sigma-70 family RNA polymerase sigma factor n=1 Tax=Streptomyces sp. NBC_00576 TaxID=2903665 RepID=UPI002E81340C|nr:sigma-70 family RNA polymerase sigma factor [Streptomyces sp. NBC_00576]WUB72599.1 sigma-70 family RNA polymerase sigma factor [Streptomyces sp. NBC_00576]